MSQFPITTDTAEDRRAAFDMTIEAARQTMTENLAGNVVKDYDVFHDETVWVFGRHIFRCLRSNSTGKPFADDPTPFGPGRDTVPLGEFRAYLESWYWPKQRTGEAA